MANRKRSVGELISSLVFFFMGLWLIREGQYLFSGGEVFKGLIVILGGALSFIAAFRFQIQKLFGDKDEYTVDFDEGDEAMDGKFGISGFVGGEDYNDELDY